MRALLKKLFYSGFDHEIRCWWLFISLQMLICLLITISGWLEYLPVYKLILAGGHEMSVWLAFKHFAFPLGLGIFVSCAFMFVLSVFLLLLKFMIFVFGVVKGKVNEAAAQQLEIHQPTVRERWYRILAFVSAPFRSKVQPVRRKI